MILRITEHRIHLREKDNWERELSGKKKTDEKIKQKRDWEKENYSLRMFEKPIEKSTAIWDEAPNYAYVNKIVFIWNYPICDTIPLSEAILLNKNPSVKSRITLKSLVWCIILCRSGLLSPPTYTQNKKKKFKL